MKKVIATLLIASSFSMATGAIQAGLGYSQGDNGGNMGTGFLGMNVLSNIGLRLEYTKNLSEHSQFSKEDISRYGLFATYTLPLTSSFSITPKVGLTKTDGEFEVLNVVGQVSDSSTNFTYGLEVNYEYNSAVSFFVGYTDYGNKFDTLDSVSASKLDTQNYMVGIKLDL